MKPRIELACEPVVKSIPLENILPLRKVSAGMRNLVKYRRIAASIREVGIIEPLVVYPQNGSEQYLLLDGHIRLDILSEPESREADGLSAPDVAWGT